LRVFTLSAPFSLLLCYSLLTVPEINYLVYRYLQESGFVHSAFTFAYESLISQSVVATQAGGDVPPGTLVAFLQKGLQLVAMEQRLNDDGSERAGADHEDFSLLTVCACTHACFRLLRDCTTAALPLLMPALCSLTSLHSIQTHAPLIVCFCATFWGSVLLSLFVHSRTCVKQRVRSR